jgi:hypothetical protein
MIIDDKYYIDEFNNRFGPKDPHRNTIISILLKSCSFISALHKKENLTIDNGSLFNEINKLWYINDHKYQRFISNMIGKTFGLYDFSINNKMTDKLENISKSEIVNKLHDDGYYILKQKTSKDTCLKIKDQLKNKDFSIGMYNLKKGVKGSKIIDKQMVINKKSTFKIINQDDIYAIPEVREIMTDKFLLDIVQSYLGCKPILVQTNLWYSCVGVLDRSQQFHQDYDDINFLKIFIYLSDVDEDSGPHRYIIGSINDIKTPPKYSPSTRITDGFALKKYGNNVKNFTGEIGTIIIENTYGFHAGSRVLKNNRLILQLEYCSSLYPFLKNNASFSKLEKTGFMKTYPECFYKYV